MTVLIILFLLGTAILYIFMFGKGSKSKSLSSNFENKMINRGFTKRIIVYDFFSNTVKSSVDKGIGGGYKHWWTVGIWLNYQKRLLALRTDRNTWDEIDIPFDKIQRVEIMEDGYTTTTGGGLGVGPVIIGGAKSNEIKKGLQIRIVTGDANGTKAYFLTLFNPKDAIIGKVNKSDPGYKAILECARSIVDECENIMRYAGQ